MIPLKQLLPGVMDAIRERRHQNGLSSEKKNALIDVLERVVDGTDARFAWFLAISENCWVQSRMRWSMRIE